MSQSARTNGHGEERAAHSGGLDGKTRMIQELTEAGVSEQHAQSIVNLLSEDFVLGKVRRSDREYARLLAENVALFAVEDYPPQRSSVTGMAGAALLGQPDNMKEPLPAGKKNELESILLASFFRTSRSEGGWQQDKLADQTQVKRLEDETQEDGDTLADKLFN